MKTAFFRPMVALLATCILSAPVKADSTLAASAELKGPNGNVIGTATFSEDDKQVTIAINASQLAWGKHGIHFHQNGKCDGPDFRTAGAHFNPENKEHGLYNPKGAHSGDLPNLDVADDGTANATIQTDRVTLSPGPRSLLKKGGTSIVIHEKADDQKSNPTGRSGARIACGVIHK